VQLDLFNIPHAMEQGRFIEGEPYPDLGDMGFTLMERQRLPSGLRINEAVRAVLASRASPQQRPVLQQLASLNELYLPTIQVSLSVEGRLGEIGKRTGQPFQDLQQKLKNVLDINIPILMDTGMVHGSITQIFDKFGFEFIPVPFFHVTLISFDQMPADNISNVTGIIRSRLNDNGNQRLTVSLIAGTQPQRMGSFIVYELIASDELSDFVDQLKALLQSVNIPLKSVDFKAHVSLYKISIKRKEGMQDLLSSAGFHQNTINPKQKGKPQSLSGLLGEALKHASTSADMEFDALVVLSQYSPDLKHITIESF